MAGTKEIFDDIKIEIPRFIINFTQALTKPRDFLIQQKVNAENSKERTITKALVYFLLCGLFAQLWQLPIYGQEKIMESATFIYSLFVPLIFLFLAAFALRLSWKVTGSDSSYLDYLILFAYHIGTLFNIYLFTNFINLSMLKYLDADMFKQVIESNYLKTESAIDPADQILSNFPYQIFTLLGIISLGGIIYWFYSSWMTYRILNKSTVKKSRIAAFIFTLLLALVFLIDAAIINALK